MTSGRGVSCSDGFFRRKDLCALDEGPCASFRPDSPDELRPLNQMRFVWRRQGTSLDINFKLPYSAREHWEETVSEPEAPHDGGPPALRRDAALAARERRARRCRSSLRVGGYLLPAGIRRDQLDEWIDELETARDRGERLVGRTVSILLLSLPVIGMRARWYALRKRLSA